MTDVVDLAHEARTLLGQAHEARAGRASKSLLHGEHQRAVLIALTAGSELAEHESPLAATLQVVTGRARLTAGEDAWEVDTSQMLPIPPARHAVTALEDCALLLTVTL